MKPTRLLVTTALIFFATGCSQTISVPPNTWVANEEFARLAMHRGYDGLRARIVSIDGAEFTPAHQRAAIVLLMT